MCNVNDVGYVVVCVEIVIVVVHIVVHHYNDFLFLIVSLLPLVYDLLPSGGLVLYSMTILDV